MKYWAIEVPEPATDAPWIHQAISVDIEMTSYMLMTYVMRNLVTEALPIMKWLVNQRNAQGGFASTQVSKRKNMYTALYNLGLWLRRWSIFLVSPFCDIFKPSSSFWLYNLLLGGVDSMELVMNSYIL